MTPEANPPERSSEDLLLTPLFRQHVARDARFTGFGGWKMPLQYERVADEHMAVREHAGLFDVSHMGEIAVEGPDAEKFLQYVTCNDVARLEPGKAQYTFLLNQDGGVIDDLIVYRLSAERFMLCVNASNSDKDLAWLIRRREGKVRVADASEEYALLALQGPRAVEILSDLYRESLSTNDFPAFSVRDAELHEGLRRWNVLLSRTGYTGEDGFEIFCPAGEVETLWITLLRAGLPRGLRPAGLGARDTLRLEAGLPLHGHELREDIPASCSAFRWVIRYDKGEFIGRAALKEVREKGVPWKLVGFRVRDPGIARAETLVFSESGAEIGFVTSGMKTPLFPEAIGMAYLVPGSAELGTTAWVDVRGRRLRIEVCKLPFYDREQGR